MEPQTLNEKEATQPVKAKKQLVLNTVAAILLMIALAALWFLWSSHVQATKEGELAFLAGLLVAFFSLLSLAFVLIEDSKVSERQRLGAGYESRVEQLQNRLDYREDMLRLVSNHQTASITIFDRHNRYFFVNDVAARLLKKPPEEIVGQPPIRILPNDEAMKLELRLAEARASDEPFEIVDRVLTESKETRFLQRHYVCVSSLEELAGCVLVREEDLTNLIVERERREQMLRQVIDTLVAVVDRRDPYATGHSLRVGQLAKAIAEEMGLDKIQVEAAEIAGSLMNFGKVLVSRRILTKTTPLTTEELQRVRESILVSADILAIIGFDGPVVPTLRQVLERYDGTGVPSGLRGEEILITARIVAACNAFVAFVSPRAHRDGLPFKEALSTMANDSGKAFDERVLIAMTHYIENRPNKIDWLKAKQ